MQEFHDQRLRQSRRLRTIARLAVGASLALAVASACSPGDPTQRLDRRTLARANTILDDVADTELSLSPETAGRLGLDKVAALQTASRLDDHSQAGFERQRLIRIDLLDRVRSRPVMPPDHPVAKDLVVADDALSRLVRVQAIGHGRFGLMRVSPYAIDPFSGIWIDAPGLLVNDHRIDTRADAEAYIARLQALPDAIDDTRRRLIADAETGVSPSADLLAATAKSIEMLTDPEAGELDLLTTTFISLTEGVDDIDVDAASEMAMLCRQTVAAELRPSYARLLETIRDLETRAPHQTGLWAQPDGGTDYLALLAWYDADVETLDSLHRANIDGVVARTAELRSRLVAAGLPPGPLAQQLAALSAEIEAERQETLTAQPPASSETSTPPDRLRDPSHVERALTPAAFTGFRLMPARLDGQRPDRIVEYVDQIERWPGYMHAAMQMQVDMARLEPLASVESPRRSRARALIAYPAVRDGWRIYASEAYERSELRTSRARIGFARLNLLNAAMAAADTGLHSQRWSLDDAVSYLQETTALPAPLMREAALRIAANPGFYAARMNTYRRLKAINERARAVLGRDYDELAFQTVLLSDGPRPMNMLERDVERWYESLLAARG